MKPLFIVFEGIDGAGTTTQCHCLCAQLRAAGHDIVQTREPGGTEAGEKIRALLLDPAFDCLDNRAELLLYAASRRQLVAQIIQPALRSHKPVISDRYTCSSLAYQGIARGLGLPLVRQVNDVATAGLHADLTIYLDLDVQTALARRKTRSAGVEDRIEKAGTRFQARVREAYLELARENPAQSLVLDAAQTAETVSIQVYDALIERFPQFPYRISV
ncbi:MAG: dTMP kinase [bacterium]|nr:dTMP kinase [bacterium]